MLPEQIAALETELVSDPAGLGYNAPGRNDQGMADIINLVRTGTATDGKKYDLWRNDVAARELVEAIVPVDFAALVQLQIAKLQLIFQAAPIDCTLPNTRGSLNGIFSGASQATRDALVAVSKRNGSRAEVLFGIGTQVTAADVAEALN